MGIVTASRWPSRPSGYGLAGHRSSVRRGALAAAAVIAAAVSAAPAPAGASWLHVSSSPSPTQPYLVCPDQGRGARCALVSDPTRGMRARGPVRAGAVTAGPEQEASPALSGTGVEGGFAPTDLRAAYGLPSTTAGAGQTVAIVDAYNDPTAEADLAVYRSKYELPPCTASGGCFRKVSQSGGTAYPAPNTGWAREISLDLDMVSAVCPSCHILLVEATTNEASDLAVAENEAVALGATEISNSFAEPTRPVSLSAYYHPGIPITAAAGDSKYGVEWPAASPHVIAVGGTSLRPPSGRGGWIESVWPNTGSGCSKEPKPAWQTDSGCAGRTNNDVAAVADTNTPVSAYDSYETGTAPWLLLGGTSVSTPIVASAMALSNPYSRSFDGAQGLYLQAAYSYGGLDDVLSGSNGVCGTYLCQAGTGYDGPSGVGTLRGAPEVPPPTPVTGAAGSVTESTAALNATVNPHGGRVDACTFEYGPTSAYGTSLPCASLPGPATVPVPVSAALSGLTPGSALHFRVLVGYSGSSAAGADASFETVPVPPTLLPAAPTALTSSAATLNAQVNPNGDQVGECRFEYGVDASYGASAPCAPSPGAGQAPVAVSVSIGGLSANTTYHYRIVAGNPAGTSYGPDQSLTTIPNPPAVATGPASALTSTSATLNGTVSPNGVSLLACEFEFASLEHYVPCSAVPGPGLATTPVSAGVSALAPGSTFRYRLIAANTGGSSYGAIQEFTTAATRASSGAARLTTSTLLVSAAGSLSARVFCPAGHARCTGSLTLTTLASVRAGARAKRALILAAGRYAAAPGRATSLSLRLSPPARALLTRSRSLHASATVLTQGVPGPWRATVTILRR